MTPHSSWPQPTLGALILSIFVAGLVLAYLSGDQAALTLMYGAVIANATSVIQFYFGSSRGSQTKDETIAAAAKLGAAQPDQPVAIAVANPAPENHP